MTRSLDVEGLLNQFPARFEPRPFHAAQDDSIQWCFENVDQYAERVDNWLTIYRAFDDHKMVGFKLKNIKVLLSAFDELGLVVEASKKGWQITLNLHQVFSYTPWLAVEARDLPMYRDILHRIPRNEYVDVCQHSST